MFGPTGVGGVQFRSKRFFRSDPNFPTLRGFCGLDELSGTCVGLASGFFAQLREFVVAEGSYVGPEHRMRPIQVCLVYEHGARPGPTPFRAADGALKD
jgi:hypothetical protein